MSLERTTGKRRAPEELERFKEEARRSKFILVDQPNFKGSPELLQKMQDYERLYREGRPAISDEEWDELVKKTGYIESLDQVVSPSGRKWMKMGAPLVSLGKIEKIDDLKKMFTGEKMIVAPKLDGLTFTAFYKYKDGELFLDAIGTRGDGLNSLIVHDDALHFVRKHWLPFKIDRKAADFLRSKGCIIDGRFELRGEAVIDKYEYCRLNDIDIDTLVPRTIAAGMLNRKSSYSVDSILNKVWLGSGKNLIETKDIYKNYDRIWKETNKDIKKMLSNFNIVNRKTDIDSIVVVKSERDGLTAFVRDRKTGKIRDFENRDKGKARYEDLYFISFSVASKDGNIDRPDIIRRIPGAMYIGDVEDFKDMYTVTDKFEEAVRVIDNIYGTNYGVRDYSKERMKNTSRFALDGCVIKPLNSNSETQKVDPTSKNGKMIVPNKPKDQVAIKLPTDPSRTRILKIIKRRTKLGNVTVSAEIEPTVVEGGATVKSVNLHNEEWLSLPENSWIKEGAECNLRMSMDIIPILSPLEDD